MKKAVFSSSVLVLLHWIVSTTTAQSNQTIWKCGFNLADRCNFTASEDMVKKLYHSHPWSLGMGLNSVWLGGPPVDAAGLVTGGYAYVDTSVFFGSSGLYPRAWLLTPLSGPTSAKGRCVQFKYNLQGLNTQALSVIKVDLLKKLETADDKHDVVVEEAGRVPKMTAANNCTNSNNTQLNLLDYLLRSHLVWSHSDSTNGKWKSGSFSYSSSHRHLFLIQTKPIPELDDRIYYYKEEEKLFDMSSEENHYKGEEGSMSSFYYKGFVALDEIVVVSGPCEEECNFDADFCDYDNVKDGTDDFDWSLARGSLKAATGPTKDQSSSQAGGTEGGYAFIDSSYPRRPGDKARLVQKVASTPNHLPKCLVLWVNMFGSGIGSLSILYQDSLSSDKKESLLWQMVSPGSSPRDLWHHASTNIPSSYEGKIIFEATVGKVGRGDIAIDSVVVQDGPCPIQPASARPSWNPLDCTFASGMCDWEIVHVKGPEKLVDMSSTGSVTNPTSPLWTRVKGGTGGIPYGHTRVLFGTSNEQSSSDCLLLFDTNNYQHRPLERSFVVSQPLSAQNLPFAPHVLLQRDICIGFWYYMASAAATNPYLATLQVVAFSSNRTLESLIGGTHEPPDVLWRLTNSQSPRWQYAQVSLSSSMAGVRIAFEGIRANSETGIVAIDDIAIFSSRNCSDEVLPPEAESNQQDCAFDSSLCNWLVLNPGGGPGDILRPQDWRLSGLENHFGTLKDHTFGIEHRGFLYFSTSTIQTMTWLVSSSAIPENVDICLTFWFAISAVVDDASNLALKRQYANGTSKSLWRISKAAMSIQDDNESSAWIHAQVPLTATTGQTLIIFEGNSKNGGFAIDDIVFMENATAPNCRLRPEYQEAASQRQTSHHHLLKALGKG